MTEKTVETRVRRLLERLSLTHAPVSLDSHLPNDPSVRLATLKTLEGVLSVETSTRQERRIVRRIQESKLPDQSTLQSFNFDFQPTLDRELIMELATLEWVDRKEDLVLTGQSGTGKSHLAKALCLVACSQGRRVRYTSCAEMLAELFATLADGSLKRVLGRYTKPSLLLVDDLGYDPIEQEQAREAQLLYKVLEARHGKASTIITSNFSAEDWGDYLGNQYLTVALLDRLLYRAVAITIDGPSYRLAKHEERQQARKKARASNKESKKS